MEIKKTFVVSEKIAAMGSGRTDFFKIHLLENGTYAKENRQGVIKSIISFQEGFDLIENMKA
jgi:hypothetical protein